MTMLFVAFICLVVLIVFSAVKSTAVYQDALATAKANPAVIEALGSPITDGFLVSGNTNVNGAFGETNLSIPISGPKGKGLCSGSEVAWPHNSIWTINACKKRRTHRISHADSTRQCIGI